jgi:hypothetical protein
VSDSAVRDDATTELKHLVPITTKERAQFMDSVEGVMMVAVQGLVLKKKESYDIVYESNK